MKTMFVMIKTMGDVILGTTLVRELRRDMPDAEICFFTDEAYVDLLKNNPDISEIRSSKHWHPDMVFMEVASGTYDRMYLPYQAQPECNIWHQNEETRYQHLVDFYWRRMGMHRPITERECYLYPTEKDRLAALEHISLDVPRIALHSTTGVSTKDWPLFSELAEELRKAGYGSVQVGGKNDRPIDGAVDLRGKMGMLELAAFIGNCAAFVGLDSGLSYMADAMKTPTIVIQGSTSPITSGPISSRVVHLFAQETGYADCQRVRCHGNCRHERNCINEIKVEDVVAALEPILDGWKKPIPVGV